MKYLKYFESEESNNIKLINFINDKSITDIIKLLDSEKINIDYQEEKLKWTPLMCSYNNVEILKLLLEYGANPNIQETDGWTVLMICVIFDCQDCAKELLKNGANLYIKNRFGNTFFDIIKPYTKIKDEIFKEFPEIYKEYLTYMKAKKYNIL